MEENIYDDDGLEVINGKLIITDNAKKDSLIEKQTNSELIFDDGYPEEEKPLVFDNHLILETDDDEFTTPQLESEEANEFDNSLILKINEDDESIVPQLENENAKEEISKSHKLAKGLIIATAALAAGVTIFVIAKNQNKMKEIVPTSNDGLDKKETTQETTTPETTENEIESIVNDAELSLFDVNDEQQLKERAALYNSQISNINGISYTDDQIADMIRVLNGLPTIDNSFDAKTAVTMLMNITSREQVDGINSIHVEDPSQGYIANHGLLFGYSDYAAVSQLTYLKGKMLRVAETGADYSKEAYDYYKEEINTAFLDNAYSNGVYSYQISDGANIVATILNIQANAILANIDENYSLTNNYVNDKAEDELESVGIQAMAEILNNKMNVHGTNLQNQHELCLNLSKE